MSDPMEILDSLQSFGGEDAQTRAHYSSLTLFRKCPQAWYYRYNQKLTEIEGTPTPYRTLGIWWSALRAAESLERGREAGSLVESWLPTKIDAGGFEWLPSEVNLSMVLLDAQTAWQKMGVEEREAFVTGLGEPLHERLGNMFQLWHERTKNERFDERPLGVEIFWERELPRPEYQPADAPAAKLIGYIDEVYMDSRGFVVVRDNKTAKTLPVGSTFDDLVDSQLPLYAWGLTPMLLAEGLPAPRITEYDRVRSVKPTTPKLTQSGTLSASITDYDLQTYLDWCSHDTRPTVDTLMEIGKPEGEEDELEYATRYNDARRMRALIEELPPGQFWGEPGAHFASGPKKGQPKYGTHVAAENVIKKYSTETERLKWFKRSATPISMATVRAHLMAAVDSCYDIWQTQARAEVHGVVPRNLAKMGCNMCDFRELCRAQIIGGPGEYDLAAYGLQVRTRR